MSMNAKFIRRRGILILYSPADKIFFETDKNEVGENIMILTSTLSQIQANKNMQKLQAISEFEDNWDGYGASKISSDVIFKTKEILRKLNQQPEIFPTGAGTIQAEYDTEYGDYLEFQIGDIPELQCYMRKNEREYEMLIPNKPEVINNLVSNFYHE